MDKNTKISFCLISCLLLMGCSIPLRQYIPDMLKSTEQINLEAAKDDLDAARGIYKKRYLQGAGEQKTPGASECPKISPPGGESNAVKPETVKERWQYLDERWAYVEILKCELGVNIASLEKKAKDESTFFLGLKGLGIGSGIASATLAAASPANAAVVAGLTVFTTGTLAFEEKATEVGLSTTVAQKKLDILKGAASEAYKGFASMSSKDYLYAYAKTAEEPEWLTAMATLGSNIVKYEAVVRYTKFEITVTTKSTSALSVIKVGSGTVKTNPQGIDCGEACSATYENNTKVTLTATQADGFTFTGWSGQCTVAEKTCIVTMNGDKFVTATFTK
jgi:uncharacterized repeat protein (TIGR02543 family)